VSRSCDVKIEYFAPQASLRRYFSAIFLIEVSVPDGGMVEDYYFPEWAALRFFSGTRYEAMDRDGRKFDGTTFPVTGHHAQEILFRIGNERLWTLNLSPLGWARLVGEPADQFANAKIDGNSHPAFDRFRPLAASLFGEEPDPGAELQRIIRFFDDLNIQPTEHDQRIEDIFVGLFDPQIASVRDLAERLSINQRTLERICLDAFGFPPKLLLRRQRFMRSLTDFMLDPSLKWIGAMDALYHDQAQFVRDFRKFMGMAPSEYAALDKPIMNRVMRKREDYIRDIVRTVRRLGDAREYGVRDR